MSKSIPIKERLEKKIVISNGCWEWTGAIDKWGYGRTYKDSKVVFAHRAAYEVYVGNIEQGMLVCHSCDNPKCINPSHLFLGTPLSNMQDKVSKDRGNFGKGVKHQLAKLNEQDVIEIRASNKSHGYFARLHGMSKSQIRSIRSRRTWKHI